MKFILQKENKYIDDIDIMIVKEILDRSINYGGLRSYSEYGISWVRLMDKKFFDNYIPIGDLDFVGTWLKKYYGISNMNPIEIPESLRIPKFLGREYKILTKDKIDSEKTLFIKNVSKLKQGSSIGNPKDMNLQDGILYQTSEVLDIKSEHRVYIIDGKIEAIVNYDGVPWLMPDINKIFNAISIYSHQKDYPKSYTMDWAITKQGTFLLEIHPFACIGLYQTLWGSNLLYAYRDGFDWYLNYNTKLKSD